MSNGNLLTRSLHDGGLAVWFGGTLMGAVGLNGAAAAAKDPTERTRLSSIGWGKWAPVQAAAIGAHVVGGLGQIGGNRKRVALDSGTRTNTIVKSVLTVVAAGLSGYSGLLGKKVYEHREEGGLGTTEPYSEASNELAAAQKQLRIVQWVIPAVTGVLVVLAAQQGEQQRGARGLLDR